MLEAITIAVLLFLVGYALGRIRKIETTMEGGSTSRLPFFSSKKKRRQSSQKEVEIDESKVVTDVKADFQKSYEDDLAESTKSKDDLSTSVSKLRDLKKKKK